MKMGVELKIILILGIVSFSIICCEEECASYLGKKKPKNLNTGSDCIKASEFPWNVAFTWKDDYKEKEPYCGGVLIDEYFVLSAAHCFFYPDNKSAIAKEKIHLNFGLEKTNLPNDIEVREVYNYSIHEHYDSSKHSNDIALVELRESVKCSEKRRVVKISGSSINQLQDINATQAGFGANETQPRSTCLRQIEIPVKKHSDCTQNNGMHF